MNRVVDVPCTDGAADNCLKSIQYQMTDEEFKLFSVSEWLPDDAVCDNCDTRSVPITVPCQDGTDPNCREYVTMFVTPAEAEAWEGNDEIPDGAICSACGSDQPTCTGDD